ncbi:MAG: ABC transporter permease [Candidatus Azobacteroides sp.]|nr:ABC transporter permease [Candidatus Azobacteroides sp.]
MFDIDYWLEILHTIKQNKSRSVLTAFGVFWGMFMFVVMTGSGSALKHGMDSIIEGFATNSCFVYDQQTTEPYKGFRKGRKWSIQNEDISLLSRSIPEIQDMTPILFGGQDVNNVVRGDKSGTYSIKGIYPGYNKIKENKLIYGRYINDIDIREKRKTCVIGERVSEVLFGRNVDPTGQYMMVKGIYFKVVGVTRNISQVYIGGRDEESVILPFTTMQQAFDMGNIVNFIAATAKPDIRVKAIEDKIKTILKKQHDIAPTDNAAVGSFNMEEQFTMFLYLEIGIAALIWIVSIGTLFAGGIGISNIMLITVRERTREIGIRRALGATPRRITLQIISESIVLTLMAGLSGLLFGVGLLALVGRILGTTDNFFQNPQISFSAAVNSLVVLLVIGTLAGLIPANRAMTIRPIEAIGEE